MSDRGDRTRWRWARGVQARFVLILLFAVIIPNALLAVWIGRSARTSALDLLEAQLHERLADAARTIGLAWVEIRSPLITLAEDPRVQAALRDSATAEAPLLVDVGPASSRLEAVTGRIVIRDLHNRVRVALVRSEDTRRAPGTLAVLPVRVPVFDPGGVLVGTAEAEVSLASLLPPIYGWGAVAGAVPAILAGDGTPLVSVTLEPLLVGDRNFEWEGEEWLAAHRAVREPALRLALAAPTAPNTAIFTAAASEGVTGLLIVLAVSVGLTLILSRGVTTSINHLTGAAEEVAAGRLDRGPLEERGPDEVRRLSRAISSMTASLRNLLKRVAQQESAAAVGEFAASLAHEVRNPLTSIRIDLERSREHLETESKVDELVARALKQVERLDATVTGALRIARSGSLDLRPIDLRDPVAWALQTASGLFAERGIDLDSWTRPDRPLGILGNASAVEQMLLNLLINAAQSIGPGEDRPSDSGAGGGRKAGHVAIETDRLADAVRVRVRDDGRGMSHEELTRAMEPFYTTRPEGTGLGLTVVKRIADAHGAELYIESTPGVGTCVTITFPEHVRSDSMPARNVA